MHDFPVTYADTCVTPLMALVAIMTAKVLHLALTVNGNFIDGKEAEPRASKLS